MRLLIAALLLSGCAAHVEPICKQIEPGRCYETGTTYRCDTADGSHWDYYPNGAMAHWRWTDEGNLTFETICKEGDY